MRILAGYRNRLVHYYNEIAEEELLGLQQPVGHVSEC